MRQSEKFDGVFSNFVIFSDFSPAWWKTIIFHQCFPPGWCILISVVRTENQSCDSGNHTKNETNQCVLGEPQFVFHNQQNMARNNDALWSCDRIAPDWCKKKVCTSLVRENEDAPAWQGRTAPHQPGGKQLFCTRLVKSPKKLCGSEKTSLSLSDCRILSSAWNERRMEAWLVWCGEKPGSRLCPKLGLLLSKVSHACILAPKLSVLCPIIGPAPHIRAVE